MSALLLSRGLVAFVESGGAGFTRSWGNGWGNADEASFFALDQVRRARRAGRPLQVIAHEDVLVFRRPPRE